MKTWYIELIVVTIILSLVCYFGANNLINWITTLAIIFTFQHAQIGDRLQERQGIMDKPTVECYWKLNYLFGIKEVLWIIAFVLMHNWAAIIGSVMFTLYPIWRKVYRKYKPMKIGI